MLLNHKKALHLLKLLDKTIKNPKTGNDIKIKSALQYDKKSPLFQAAKSMLKKKK
jgi:undecaprenyl pyrophosphate synthase